MKVELEIITDRLPTETDGELVLEWADDCWICRVANSVKLGTPWMRQPPPPPKPLIDTSLAASIERDSGRELSAEGKCRLYSQLYCECVKCDKERIIDAARKWDALERSGAGALAMYSHELSPEMQPCDDPPKPNDPDGVGEGWRLLREGEARVDGYQYRKDKTDSWTIGAFEHVGMVITDFDLMSYQYRRRIEAEQ